jgi:hypothetical protein
MNLQMNLRKILHMKGRWSLNPVAYRSGKTVFSIWAVCCVAAPSATLYLGDARNPPSDLFFSGVKGEVCSCSHGAH